MTENRGFARLAKGLGALMILAGLIVGLPAALAVTVGWPLPNGLPRLSDISSALGGQSIDDAFLLKTLAVLCWLAWGQFTACVVAEMVGWRQGRGSCRVPLAGSLQPLVARLMIAAALVVHIGPRPSPPPVLVRTVAAVHLADTAPPAPTSITPAASPTLPVEQATKTYVVKPRDDLWRLAERHLGDGARWRELFKTNQGRPQPDGGALRSPRLIRPGWILEFPTDAAMPADASPPAGDHTAPEASVAFSAPVAVLETVPTTPDAPACPASTGPETQAAVSLPPGDHPDEIAVPLSSAPSATTAPAPLAAANPAHPSGATHDPGSPGLPAGLLGAGLLATGLVATLDRLRRAQQRRRPRHRAVRMAGPSAVPTEVALRRAAACSPAGRLDLALRAFANCGMNRRSGEGPAISAVQVGPDGQVEVLLAGRLDAEPGPFEVSADSQVWTLRGDVSDAVLRETLRDVGAPVPGLVTVGALAGTTVLIDVEAAGCTSLVGDEEATSRALRTMGLELATSTWADTIDVILVSSEPRTALSALERVRVASTLAEVIDDIAADAAALNDALTRIGAPTTLDARLGTDAADGWIPSVVLCDDPAADPSAFAHLLALAAGGGRGLAVIVRGDVPEAGRVVHFRRDVIDVTPPGVTLAPVGPSTTQTEALGEILEAAADPDGVEPGDDIVLGPADGAPRGPVVDMPYQEHDFDVLVRLLGPVEIEGAKAPVDRRKAVEMVVYLATHSDGLDDERLKTALWPDDQAPQSSFNTTVTRARSRLGTDPDGHPHLPHLVAAGGLYKVGPRVTTDFAILQRRLVAARQSTPDVAARTLRDALELVRGAPFTGVRQGYEWAYAEGLVARIELVVADAAHHLAQLALERRDPEVAHWAAVQGLLASPGDEVLYRDRMLACDLAGNPAGVEAVMDELVAVAEALEPYDTLHPETIALYERLSHRRRRTG